MATGTSFEDAVRAVTALMATKGDTIPWQIGYLGDGIGTDAPVKTARENYIWVRYPYQTSPAVPVLCMANVPMVAGIRVKVGYLPWEPGVLQVIALSDARLHINNSSTGGDTEVPANPGDGTSYAPVTNHWVNHQYLGVDQGFINWRQITPLGVYPTSPASLSVRVRSGYIPRPGADIFVTEQTIDLTSSVPVSGARYVLISIDSTGTVVATDGTINPGGFGALTSADIPDTPSGNWRSAAVVLYPSQTKIVETRSEIDIYDLRFPEEHNAGLPVLTHNYIFVGSAADVAVGVNPHGDADIADDGNITFATVNSNVGTFGSATQVPQLTVNGKGLITAVSNVTIAGVSPVGAALTSGQIWVGSASNVAAAVAVSNDATLSDTGALTLATVNANVGTFGSATKVAQITVNGKGLITAASEVSITFPTAGHVVQDEGTPLAQQPNLNFAGAGVTVTNDSGNNATLVTIPGGAGSPGGLDTHVQFNDGSAFGGDADFTWNKTTNVLTLGQASLDPSLLTGAHTFQFPDAAGTIALISDLSAYQPVDTTLTTLSALADASGWLHNDGAGTLTWTSPPAAPVGADPTASVGLTTVNGAATTFMRSDAAPALSQAIAPTWTGAHIFNNTIVQTPTLSASGVNVATKLTPSYSGTVATVAGVLLLKATIAAGMTDLVAVNSLYIDAPILGTAPNTHQAIYIEAVTGATYNYAIFANGGVIKSTDATDSSSVSTGAFIVDGGAAIVKSLNVGGKLGVGVAVATRIGVNLGGTVASAGEDLVGIMTEGMTLSPDNGRYATALDISPIFDKGAGGTTYPAVYGIYLAPSKMGSGTITTAYGLYVDMTTVPGATNYAISTNVGLVAMGDTTDSTAVGNGSVVMAGGASVAKKLFVGTSLNIAGTSNQIVLQSAGVTGTLTWTPTSSDKTITLPDLTGTVALGAGTATVATTNSVTVASHTHAVTSSAAPGAAASLLATDSSGNLTIAGTLKASGTTDASSTITGTLQSAGGLGVAKSIYGGASLYLNSNAAALPANLLTGTTSVQIAVADSANNRVLIDAFAAIPILDFRRANGTSASKSALAANDLIGVIAASGYGASAYGSTSTAQIRFAANQTWTGANQGTFIQIYTTPNNSTAALLATTIGADQSLVVAGTIDASSVSTGALQSAGGLGVAKKAYFGDKVDSPVAVSGYLPMVNYGSFSSSLSANGIVCGAAVGYAATIKRFAADTNVAATNNGTNYWTVRLINTHTGAIITSFNTSADTAGTWTYHESTGLSTAVSATSVYVDIVKTNSPGAISFVGASVYVE